MKEWKNKNSIHRKTKTSYTLGKIIILTVKVNVKITTDKIFPKITLTRPYLQLFCQQELLLKQ